MYALVKKEKGMIRECEIKLGDERRRPLTKPKEGLALDGLNNASSSWDQREGKTKEGAVKKMTNER